MLRFERWVKGHLAEYKLERLGIVQRGLYIKNKKRYSHILPTSMQKLNIIETYRKEFWEYFAQKKNTITLHDGFSHLNSSQAMCFNLFFPLLYENKLKTFLDIIGINCEIEHSLRAEFEKVIFTKENTHFDFYMETDHQRIFFETKYAEQDFGSADPDIRHTVKYEKIYARGQGFANINPQYQKKDKFLTHYQIVRNMWYIRKENNDYLIFIYPKINEKIAKYKKLILEEIPTTDIKNRIKIIYLEELVADIQKNIVANEHNLATHFKLFKEKYFPK